MANKMFKGSVPLFGKGPKGGFGLKVKPAKKSPLKYPKIKAFSLNTKPKKKIFQIGTPSKRRPVRDKNLNWTQASTRYRKLSPFADTDRDGIQNWLDCRPLNKNMQGPLHKKKLKHKFYDQFGREIKKVRLAKGKKAKPITPRGDAAKAIKKATMQGKFPFQSEKKGTYILKDEPDWKTLPPTPKQEDTDTAMIEAPAILGGKKPLPPQVPASAVKAPWIFSGEPTRKEAEHMSKISTSKGLRDYQFPHKKDYGKKPTKTITGATIERKAKRAKIIHPKKKEIEQTDITITPGKVRIKVDEEKATPGEYALTDPKTLEAKWKHKKESVDWKKQHKKIKGAEKGIKAAKSYARKTLTPAAPTRYKEKARAQKRAVLGGLGVLGLVQPSDLRSISPRTKGVKTRRSATGKRGRPAGSYKNVIPGKGPVHIYEYRKWLRRQRALKRLQREPEYEQFEGERIQETEDLSPQGQVTQERFTEDRGGYEAIQQDRGEMRAGETTERGKSSILSTANVFNEEERARLPPMKDPVQDVDTVHKPVVNPEGDYYTDVDPLSGKPILQRRVRERWASGE